MRQLTRLSEPLLLFGHGQAMEDPRDGLTLFGPFDTGSVFAIRTGVVGTPSGIEKFKAWTQRIKTRVCTKNPIQARPPFSGFEAVFRIPWSDAPLLILLGEIRSGEAFDLLQLLNTGHSGTISTIHASSAKQGLSRFTSCVLQSGVEIPYRAIKTNIGDSLSNSNERRRTDSQLCSRYIA